MTEPPNVKAALAVMAAFFLLAGCVPMKELRAGPEKERLVEVARRYCAAELSSDPADTHALFVASLRDMLERSPTAGAAVAADAQTCEPGRAWYRGGSRMFVDVRRGDRTERLGFWRGAWPLIDDVAYLTPRRAGGRKVKTLREALMVRPEAADAEVPAPPALPDRECVPDYYHFAFLETDTRVYRQGATVKLTPKVDMAPAGTQEVPVRCTSGWSVRGPATLSADRTALTIAPDAPVGALVIVAFRHAGKPVEAQFRVISRDEVVLTGRWSQRSVEGCRIAEPVGELEFMPENRFSVTFRPFETYRDYWGTYSFDAATGRIALEVEGGNFVPPGLDLEGEAERGATGVVLKGLFLGSRQSEPQQDCIYRF